MTDAFNQIITIVNASGKLKADGIPVSLVNKLSKKEKEQVEDILINMVLSNDLTGLDALASLRTEKAIQVIKTLFDKTDNNSILKIELAKLLWEATNDSGYLKVVLADFKPKDNTEKLTLIHIYLQLPPQTVPDAKYIDIIKNESYAPIRFQAGKGLLYNLKILSKSSEVQFGDPLHNLLRKLSDENPQIRDSALEEVYALAP